LNRFKFGQVSGDRNISSNCISHCPKERKANQHLSLIAGNYLADGQRADVGQLTSIISW